MYTYFISYAVPTRNGFGQVTVSLPYKISTGDAVEKTKAFLGNNIEGLEGDSIVILFFQELK